MEDEQTQYDDDGSPGEAGFENEPPDPPEEAIVISSGMLAPEPPRDARIDFEKGISYAPRLTLTIIGVNVIVFIWELATGALESKDSIIAAGALYRPLVMAGEVWRMATAMFLHAGFDHLIGNCIILYVLGMACEHALGWKQTVVLYLVAGLCGAVLSMAASPGPSIGASGAIFGIAGAVIVFMHRFQRFFIFRNKRVGAVLLVWAIYSIGLGFATPYVDNFCHIGGLVGGAAFSLLLRVRLLGPAAAEQATEPG